MTAEGDGVHLLDANVLIALTVVEHVHHEVSARWFMSVGRFATCPITQGSLLRFLVREGATAVDAGRFLDGITSDERHHFWPDELGYDRVRLGAVVGHRQVTDAYLAALAGARGGRLATLDSGLAALHHDVADLVPS